MKWIFDEVPVGSRFALFEVITLTIFRNKRFEWLLLVVKFVFSLSLIYKKKKLEQQNKHRPKCIGDIFPPNMFFSGFYQIHGPPSPPTNRPPTTYAPTHLLPNYSLNQQSYLAELTIETFILQNTRRAGKTTNIKTLE